MSRKFQLNKTSLAKYSWSGSGIIGGIDDAARTGNCASRRITSCQQLCTEDVNGNTLCDAGESGTCPNSVTFCV